MEKLELKYIIGYLPYDLRMLRINESDLSIDFSYVHFVDLHNAELFLGKRYKQGIWKPVLRPLSDLTKEVEHNGEKFVPINELKYLYGWEYLWSYVNNKQGEFNINAVKYSCVQKLYEWHFDIHNLIEKGLAIDINIIKNEL